MKKLILVGVLALAAGGALQIKVDGGVVAAASYEARAFGVRSEGQPTTFEK